MEKVTKKDLLNKDKEIDNKQQMQLELKEIKPIFQIISDLVKAVAYNTTFDEKNNINVIKILDTIEETEKVPLYKLNPIPNPQSPIPQSPIPNPQSPYYCDGYMNNILFIINNIN